MTIPLFPAERAELDRLRVEVVELRETLAEFERLEAHDARDEALFKRLYQVKRSLGLAASPALILLDLLDHPGRVRRRFSLRTAMARFARTDEGADKIVDMQLVKVRRALSRHGLPEVRTVWGQGWMIDAASAETIKRFIERMG